MLVYKIRLGIATLVCDNRAEVENVLDSLLDNPNCKVSIECVQMPDEEFAKLPKVGCIKETETDDDFTGHVGQIGEMDFLNALANADNGNEIVKQVNEWGMKYPYQWPFYCFRTASVHFWNGFARGLRQMGFTEEQVAQQIQTKNVRYMMDEHHPLLEQLGERMARNRFKPYRETDLDKCADDMIA